MLEIEVNLALVGCGQAVEPNSGGLVGDDTCPFEGLFPPHSVGVLHVNQSVVQSPQSAVQIVCAQERCWRIVSRSKPKQELVQVLEVSHHTVWQVLGAGN